MMATIIGASAMSSSDVTLLGRLDGSEYRPRRFEIGPERLEIIIVVQTHQGAPVLVDRCNQLIGAQGVELSEVDHRTDVGIVTSDEWHDRPADDRHRTLAARPLHRDGVADADADIAHRLRPEHDLAGTIRRPPRQDPEGRTPVDALHSERRHSAYRCRPPATTSSDPWATRSSASMRAIAGQLLGNRPIRHHPGCPPAPASPGRTPRGHESAHRGWQRVTTAAQTTATVNTPTAIVARVGSRFEPRPRSRANRLPVNGTGRTPKHGERRECRRRPRRRVRAAFCSHRRATKATSEDLADPEGRQGAEADDDEVEMEPEIGVGAPAQLQRQQRRERGQRN